LATLPAAIWVRLANAVAILNLAVERCSCIANASTYSRTQAAAVGQ
jgi:hypothetical protein